MRFVPAEVKLKTLSWCTMATAFAGCGRSFYVIKVNPIVFVELYLDASPYL